LTPSGAPPEPGTARVQPAPTASVHARISPETRGSSLPAFSTRLALSEAERSAPALTAGARLGAKGLTVTVASSVPESSVSLAVSRST
jgi:hypothetical protein